MLRSESRQTAPTMTRKGSQTNDQKRSRLALSGTTLGEKTHSTGSIKRPGRAPRVRSGQVVQITGKGE